MYVQILHVSDWFLHYNQLVSLFLCIISYEFTHGCHDMKYSWMVVILVVSTRGFEEKW